MLIDRQGRLLGRVNLFDLLMAGLLTALLFPPFYFAYCVSGLREIEISSIEPSRLVIGENKRMKIHGAGFSPNCRIKLSTIDLGRPGLATAFYLEVDVPPELAPGWYHPIVIGPRHSSVAIMPILAVWKPEVLAVSPVVVHSAQETTLTVEGKRFQPDSEATLAGIPLPQVEYVRDSLFRVKVPPGSVPPGPSQLRVTNRSSGESDLFYQPITVFGRKTVPISAILSLEDVPEPYFEYLQEISEGKPIVSPDTLEFLEVLSAICKNPPSGKKIKKKDKNPPSYEVEVQVGLVGTLEFGGGGYFFTFMGFPLRPNGPVNLKVNGVPFHGTVHSKPIVRDPSYLEVSR